MCYDSNVFHTRELPLSMTRPASMTWINTGVNRNRILKVPSSNCNRHRLVYLRQWHIQMEIDITNSVSLSDNINATRSWDSVLTLSLWSVGSSLSIIVMICWIESVDPVADSCLTNQILYRIILFSPVECFRIQINHWTAKQSPRLKCCSKMWTRGLKGCSRGCKTLTRCYKMAKRELVVQMLDDGEMRTRGCKTLKHC